MSQKSPVERKKNLGSYAEIHFLHDILECFGEGGGDTGVLVAGEDVLGAGDGGDAEGDEADLVEDGSCLAGVFDAFSHFEQTAKVDAEHADLILEVGVFEDV